MKNIESLTTKEIMNLLTKLLMTYGYDVELECIHTFEVGQSVKLKTFSGCYVLE